MEYRSKVVDINAIQWNGNNKDQIKAFGKNLISFQHSVIPYDYQHEQDYEYLLLLTSQGGIRIRKGDYLIKGYLGQIYTLRKQIFQKQYERKH